MARKFDVSKYNIANGKAVRKISDKPKKPKKKPPLNFNTYTSVPPSSEHEFQVYCHSWFLGKFGEKINSYAIPNGAKTESTVIQNKEGENVLVNFEKEKNKREGLLRGAADYFIQCISKTSENPYGIYAGLYIELKYNKGSQRADQKEFQEKALKSGYQYVVVRNNTTVLDNNGAIDPLLHFKEVVYKYLDSAIIY
jgi:hypothetical protein